MLSPLRLGAQYELMRRYPNLPEPAEVVWVPPPPEPNFRIDDLLDFSNSELCDDEVVSDGGEEEGTKEGCGDVSIEFKVERSAGKSQEVSEQAATSGLCVPVSDLPLFLMCCVGLFTHVCTKGSVCMCMRICVCVCAQLGQHAVYIFLSWRAEVSLRVCLLFG